MHDPSLRHEYVVVGQSGQVCVWGGEGMSAVNRACFTCGGSGATEFHAGFMVSSSSCFWISVWLASSGIMHRCAAAACLHCAAIRNGCGSQYLQGLLSEDSYSFKHPVLGVAFSRVLHYRCCNDAVLVHFSVGHAFWSMGIDFHGHHHWACTNDRCSRACVKLHRTCT